MATISIISLHAHEKLEVSRQNMMLQLERAERKNFTRNVTFDFRLELKKRNTVLILVFDDAKKATPGSPALAAYAVFVHSQPGNVVTVHRICV